MSQLTKVLIKLGSDLKEIDVNQDGVIDGKEVRAWISKKTSDGTISEYFFIFAGAILALIGYFKPEWNWDDWAIIFSIALILANFIFTGIIKSRVLQKLKNKEQENETLKETNMALREALVKSTGSPLIKEVEKAERPPLE